MKYASVVSLLLSLAAVSSASPVPAQNAPPEGNLQTAIEQLVSAATSVDGSAGSIQSVVSNALNVASQAVNLGKSKRGLDKRQFSGDPNDPTNPFGNNFDPFAFVAEGTPGINAPIPDGPDSEGGADDGNSSSSSSSTSCSNGKCVSSGNQDADGGNSNSSSSSSTSCSNGKCVTVTCINGKCTRKVASQN